MASDEAVREGAEGSESPESSQIAIRARGLTRRFGKVVAVDGLDLDIPKRRIYGFLGPNGSGKTTTIRMLCGLLRPSEGTARVLGLDVPQQAEALRRKIGYMTQRFTLFEDLTVRENLDFLGQIQSLRQRERRRRLAELVERYRLAEQVDQLAGTLSGGQRQRLALAAALLHAPELLFLDEPTSAVDPENRRDFWESLFELVDEGTTILVSTHYMDEAERCHGLAILKRGRLVAAGAPRELMESLGARVVEVETERLGAARRALAGDPRVLGSAQLGARLRVLVAPEEAEPLAAVRELLEAARVAGEIELARPSLEDVFVLSTREPAALAASAEAG